MVSYICSFFEMDIKRLYELLLWEHLSTQQDLIKSSFVRSGKKPVSKITRAIHKPWNLPKLMRHQTPLKTTLTLRLPSPKAKETSNWSKKQSQALQPTFLMVDFRLGLSQ